MPRWRVRIRVEALEDEVVDMLAQRLKGGSESIQRGVWETDVLVTNADTFLFCLKWKYERTMQRRAEHGLALSLDA